jgi:hypothetical protein
MKMLVYDCIWVRYRSLAAIDSAFTAEEITQNDNNREAVSIFFSYECLSNFYYTLINSVFYLLTQ